jgi:hypothetical protein
MVVDQIIKSEKIFEGWDCVVVNVNIASVSIGERKHRIGEHR